MKKLRVICSVTVAMTMLLTLLLAGPMNILSAPVYDQELDVCIVSFDNDDYCEELFWARVHLRNSIEHYTEHYNERHYTRESWAVFQDAIASAREVYNNSDATVEELFQAIDEMWDARDELIASPLLILRWLIVNEADWRDARNYTPDSWAVFQEALTHAREVYDNADATEEEITKAYDKLREATFDLETASLVLLGWLIESTERRDVRNYTPDSWAVLQEALTSARDVYGNADATEEEITKAYDKLREAMSGLIQRPHSYLRRVIHGAEGLLEREDQYTLASWAVFAEALVAAEELYAIASSVPQAERFDVAINLLAADFNLIPSATSASRIHMAESIYIGERVIEEGFYYWFWTECELSLQEALAVAQLVYSNPNSTRTEISFAVSELWEHIRGSGVGQPGPPGIFDRHLLVHIIQVAEGRQQELYTQASWAAMQAALAEARAKNNMEKGDQFEADLFTVNLHTALSNLVIISDNGNNNQVEPNRAGLIAALARANDLVEANYTAASWATFQTALANARTVYQNTNATQAEINAATTALTVAMNALVTITTPTPCEECEQDQCTCPATTSKTALATAITAAQARVEASYTPASWATFQTALAEARLVYNNPNATQAQIDVARTALVTAMNNLVRRPDTPRDTAGADTNNRAAPKTGDTAMMNLWFMIFVLGFLGFATSSTGLAVARLRKSKSTILVIEDGYDNECFLVKRK